MTERQKTKYSDIEKESFWVSEHQKELEKYAGKWIAVLNKKVVGSGDTVTEAMREVDEKGIKQMPLVTSIDRKDEGIYMFYYV